MPAAAADAAGALPALFLGYAALLATPGPNMVAVGGIAAARGFARALPICLGLVAGAASLACAACSVAAADGAATVAGARDAEAAGRVLGAALLAWVAAAQFRCGDAEAGGETGARGAAFCAGFCTAATNPLTAAFFAAQAASGPLGGWSAGWAFLAAALGGVVAMALGFYLGMAALMANPVARRAALRWRRPIRLASAGALLLLAAAVLRPVLIG